MLTPEQEERVKALSDQYYRALEKCQSEIKLLKESRALIIGLEQTSHHEVNRLRVQVDAIRTVIARVPRFELGDRLAYLDKWEQWFKELIEASK